MMIYSEIFTGMYNQFDMIFARVTLADEPSKRLD